MAPVDSNGHRSDDEAAKAGSGTVVAATTAIAPAPDAPPAWIRPASIGLAKDDRLIRLAVFRDGKVTEQQGSTGLIEALASPDTTVWIDLTDPSPEQVTDVTRLVKVHDLVAEDILERNQRAKIEVTDDLVHIVMFQLEYTTEMVESEIDFVLGRRFLLTAHEPAWDPRTTIHLREGLAPIMSPGSDHLLWALVDSLVDDYFPFIDRMGDEIDEIEDLVVRKADPAVLSRLFDLKRDLLTARRATSPVREVFNQLTNRDMTLIDHAEVVYFRDVYDHLIRLTDEIDSYRELVSGTLDVYLSTVNNNLSIIMKRLTGVTVILAGIAAVAGIFGMSEAGAAFEAGRSFGFWLVTFGTVAAAIGAAAWLHRIDWI